MNSPLNKFHFFLIILWALSSSSCYDKKMYDVVNSISIESGEIPPDMATEDFKLIGILKGKRRFDRHIEKAYETYWGEYILVPEEEIYTGEYARTFEDAEADTIYSIAEYRYLVHFRTEHVPLQSDHNVWRNTCYILDRQTGKTYHRKRGSSMFAKELKAVLYAIERIRKK